MTVGSLYVSSTTSTPKVQGTSQKKAHKGCTSQRTRIFSVRESVLSRIIKIKTVWYGIDIKTDVLNSRIELKI